MKRVAADCFVFNEQSVSMFKDDRPGFDLSLNAWGKDLDYLITDGGDHGYIEPSFPDLENPQDLLDTESNCSHYAEIAKNDVMYLCDSRLLVRAFYDETNGRLLSSSKIDLGPNASCQSIARVDSSFELVLACLDNLDKSPWRNMVFISYDIEKSEIVGYLNISQSIQENLRMNLTMTLHYPRDDTERSAVVIIREKDEYAPIKTRLFSRSKDGKWSFSGFFVGNQSIGGVNHTSGLVDFFSAGDYPFVVVRNSETFEAVILRCHLKLSENFIDCDDPAQRGATMMSNFGMHAFAFAKDFGGIWSVILASNQSSKEFYLTPNAVNWTYSANSNYDLTGSTMTHIKSVLTAGNNLYMIGKTHDNKNVIVYYREGRPNYEDKIFPDPQFKAIYIRSGLMKRESDLLSTVRNGKTYSIQVGRPVLIVNPRNGETKFDITVACFSKSQYSNSFVVSVSVLNDLTDGGSMRLPTSFDIFSGTSKMHLSTVSTWLEGNAARLTVSTPSADVSSIIEYASTTDASTYDGTMIKSINDSISLGNGYIALTDIDRSILVIVYCQIFNHTLGKCSDKITLSLTGVRLLAGAANLNQVTLMFKNFSEESKDTGVIIQAFDTKDFTKTIDNQYANVRALIGAVHSNETDTNVVIVGYLDDKPSDLCLAGILSIRPSSMSASQSFSRAMMLPNRFVPMAIAMRPSKVSVQSVYVAGSFGSPETNRLFKIIMSLTRINDTSISLVYKRYMKDTNKFDICASDTMLAVIAFDRNEVKAFNLTTGDAYWSVEMPLLEYNVKEIYGFNCDGEAGILQIVGGNRDQGDFKLVTFRMKSYEKPTQRVHSVIQLPSAAVHVGSWDTEDQMKMYGVTFGTDSSQIHHYTFITEGPRISLDTSKISGNNSTRLSFEMTLQAGGNSTKINSDVNLNLHAQKSTVDIRTRNFTIKPTLSTGQEVSLEDYYAFDGPTLNFSLQASGLELVQRIQESSRQTVTGLDFIEVVREGSFIFGFTSTRIVLMKEGTEILAVENQRAIDIGALPNRSTFAAVAYPDGKISGSQIILFSNVTGTWAVYKNKEKNSTYTRMVFLEAQEMVVYFGLNNETEQIDYGTMNVTEGKATEYDFHIANTPSPIDFFDIVQLTDKQLIFLITSESRGSMFRYTLYKAGYRGMIWDTEHQDDPVDDSQNKSKIIRGLECSLSKTQDNFVLCIQLEEALQSKIVGLKIDTNPPLYAKWVNRTEMLGINNLANTKLIRSDISGNYSAVVVQNRDLKIGINGWQGSPYMVLIYAVHLQSHPYKFLLPEDFGYPPGTSLPQISPYFFTNDKGESVLSVFSPEKSGLNLITFTINGLTLRVKDSQSAVNSQTRLSVSSLDGSQSISDIKSVIDFDRSTANNSRHALIIVIVAVIVVVGGGVCGYLYYVKCNAEDGRDVYSVQKEEGDIGNDEKETLQAGGHSEQHKDTEA